MMKELAAAGNHAGAINQRAEAMSEDWLLEPPLKSMPPSRQLEPPTLLPAGPHVASISRAADALTGSIAQTEMLKLECAKRRFSPMSFFTIKNERSGLLC